MIIQSDCLNKIGLVLLAIFQVFLDDFFETINVELLLKRGVQVE